jgi:hypothetical protein
MMDELKWIQTWFRQQCDGDWEHSHGIHIETLDNPGWQLVVDLDDTTLAGKSMAPIDIERSDDDWVFAAIEDGRFCVRCGPVNFTEAIAIFRRWTENPDAPPVDAPGSPHAVD